MKLSPIQILFLLVLIVTVSVYLGRKTFENELTVYSRGVDTDGLFQLGSEGFVESLPACIPSIPSEASMDSMESSESFIASDPSRQSTVVPVTSTAYEAISLKQRSDMLKEIQGLVRNELLAARQLEKVGAMREEEEEEEHEHEQEQESQLQGVDFNRRCNKPSEGGCPKNYDGSCPPVPDLSNYIRKDQIPCWGCSIDY